MGQEGAQCGLGPEAHMKFWPPFRLQTLRIYHCSWVLSPHLSLFHTVSLSPLAFLFSSPFPFPAPLFPFPPFDQSRKKCRCSEALPQKVSILSYGTSTSEPFCPSLYSPTPEFSCCLLQSAGLNPDKGSWDCACQDSAFQECQCRAFPQTYSHF